MRNYTSKEKAIIIEKRLNDLLPQLTLMDPNDPFVMRVVDNYQDYNPKTKSAEGIRIIPVILRSFQTSIPGQEIGYFPENVNLNVYIPNSDDEDMVIELFQLYKETYNQKTFKSKDDEDILELVADAVLDIMQRSNDGRNKYASILQVQIRWLAVRGFLTSYDSNLIIDGVLYNPLSVTYAQIKSRDTFKPYNTDIDNRFMTEQSLSIVLPLSKDLSQSKLFHSVHRDNYNELFRIVDTYGEFESDKDWELQSGGVTRTSGDLSLFSATFMKPLPRVKTKITVIDGENIIEDDPVNPMIITSFSPVTNTSPHLRANEERKLQGVAVRQGTSFSLQFLHTRGNPLSESLAYQAMNQKDNYSLNIEYENEGLVFTFNNLGIFDGSHGVTTSGIPMFTVSLMEKAGDL